MSLTALGQASGLQAEPFAVYNLFGDPGLRLEIPPPTAQPLADAASGEG